MKKLRTRQHIIEDLGFNHIEKQILLSGNVLRRFGDNDYGYDGMIDTFSAEGEAENLSFKFQLKSTDNMELSHQKAGFAFDLSKRDLELWLKNAHPVLLIHFRGEDSSSRLLSCGVSHGSRLGPLLFSLYATDLYNIAANRGVGFHSYADDIQLFVHSKANIIETKIDYLLKTLFG